MAHACGPHSPYGCGHPEEHRRVALLGWRRRRAGGKFQGSDEQRYASAFHGSRVTQAHTSERHPNEVMFRADGQWYSVPRRDWRSFLSIGRGMLRDEEKAERQRRKNEQREERLREREDRWYHHQEHKELSQVNSMIRQRGGIRPTKHTRGELEYISPRLVSSRSRFTLDTMREAVMEYFPHLGLENEHDLVDFLQRGEERERRYQERHRTRPRTARRRA